MNLSEEINNISQPESGFEYERETVQTSSGEFEADWIRHRKIDIKDAIQWVIDAGQDPEDYDISVRTIAYGRDMWSNRMSATPKRGIKTPTIPALKSEEVEAVFANYPPPTPIIGTNTTTPILNIADLQIGKAHQRGGGTPETLERVKQSFATFKQYLIDGNFKQAVIVDNGDPIENCFNTPDQLVTNDLSVPEQIRVARRIFLEAVKQFAPHVEKLYYVSIPSNHGAHRTGYKSPGGTVDADFGLEISYQVEDAVEMDGTLKNVEFIRPEPLHETATITVSNTKLGFHHGHQSGGQNGLAKWWKGQDHGRLPGWDADIMVFGHYHNLRIETTGNGRYLIGVSSSEPGSDWFSNKTGESARRGMTTFDVADGNFNNLRII